MKRVISFLLVFALLAALPLPAVAFETNFGYQAVCGSVMLPLEEFPVGSYCTTTGEACSSSHNDCLRYYTTPDGETVDTMGWQCMGFARYVFYRCFGIIDFNDDSGIGYKSAVRNLNSSKTTPEYLKTVFGTTVLAGAHIRVGNNWTGHSMIYLGSDETYVYTYEGNYAHHCDVTVNQRTWEEFCSFALRKGGIAYIHMPLVYPEQMDWNCTTDGHKWGLISHAASSCVANGTDTYRCVFCAEKCEESLPLGEHTYQATLSKFVTKQTDGELTYRCSVCQDSYTKPIAALGVCAGGEACPAIAMTDIPPVESWAHEGLDFVLANMLFQGTSATTFSPNATMTRAMLVTVLYRLEQALPAVPPHGEDAQTVFTDVAQDRYFTEAVAWAAKNGIVSGIGDNCFAPDDMVSRQQIAVILQRYLIYRGLEAAPGDELTAFPDCTEVSGYALEAMRWAVAEKLINGVASQDRTVLEPRGNATRAQVAAILMRLIEAKLS